MRTAVEISLIDPQVIEVQEISSPEISPEDKLFESLLILDQDEFNQIIKSYKLPYESQKKFNTEFAIDEYPKKDDKNFTEYLQSKINLAFKNPQLIQRYFEAMDKAPIAHDEGRDIHDGV